MRKKLRAIFRLLICDSFVMYTFKDKDDLAYVDMLNLNVFTAKQAVGHLSKEIEIAEIQHENMELVNKIINP